MKRAFCIKIAVLLTLFSALLSFMIMPAFSYANAKSEERIADGFNCDINVNLLTLENKSTVGNLKALGNDYELPFIPVETNHDWDDGVVTTPPTCTQPGVKTYTCKLNSKHTYTKEIPATGHKSSEAVFENVIEPTCEAAGGKDEVVYCSVCQEEISRNHIDIPASGHNWGEWVQTKAPTETEPGEETRTCKHDPNHTETREVPALGPSFSELSFLDDEVIIVVPGGATPDGSEFDVQKIVPPPAEVVEKVKEQMEASTEVLAYYEIRLNASDGASIIYLDGEITIKTKMFEQYIGNKYVQMIQEDESGEMVVMKSWWEGEYLCYKTDWLEIYK